jgi:hypothetical protein
MTTHEMGRYLLTLPDLPTLVSGWGADESKEYEVVGASEDGRRFLTLELVPAPVSSDAFKAWRNRTLP